MRDHSHRLSRADRERLLAGDPAGSGRLGELISAAGSAADPAELTGLDAAVAAFASAPAAGPHTIIERRRSMLKTLASSLLATKVLAGAAAAAAVGGVAVAAGTGHLGNAAPAHHTPGGPGSASATASQAPGFDTAAPPTASEGQPSATPPAGTGKGSATPSPSLVGLCHAWQAHENNSDNPGSWADSPAFTVLITTAGGTSAVDGYCTTLLGTTPSHSHPAGKPTAVPSHSHPAGKPTAVPSHSHPAGKPTAVPSHSHPTAAPSHP